MQCPLCTAPLAQNEYEGVHIHTCESCGGELLGGDELAHIVSVRTQTFPESLLEQVAGPEPTVGVPDEETYRELPCPACQTPMQVINYCNDTDVHIDRCGSCGSIWLDAGELEKTQIILERWQDDAGEKIAALQPELELRRSETDAKLSAAGRVSRFAFVNAILSRFLDAA